MGHLEYSRRIDAPPSVVWDVITNNDLYAEAAPNLTSVEVIEEMEDTMVRRCVDTNDNVWTEACTTWENGRRFAVEVDVVNSDFHRRLFDRFEGEWGIVESDGELELVIRFDYDTKYGPFGHLISAFLAYKAPGLVEAIFDRWEVEIERRSASQDRQQTQPPTNADGGRINALYS